MNTSYAFNTRRRLVGALPPLGIAVALAVLLAVFGTSGTWRFWLVAALIALLLLRAAAYLWWGRNELVVDDGGVTRSGKTVRFHSAQLELRTVTKGDRLVLREVVLWEPVPAGGGREGVGFDDSLDRFTEAVRALVARVPETRIVVRTPTEPNVTDERREQVLGPLRPTPAERALLELGRSALSVPPHLRS